MSFLSVCLGDALWKFRRAKVSTEINFAKKQSSILLKLGLVEMHVYD